MTPEEMEQVRPRLETFAAGMLGGLARVDQRAKGGLAQRARIVLLAAEGLGTKEIVRRTGVSKPTVIAWKRRYVAEDYATHSTRTCRPGWRRTPGSPCTSPRPRGRG